MKLTKLMGFDEFAKIKGICKVANRCVNYNPVLEYCKTGGPNCEYYQRFIRNGPQSEERDENYNQKIKFVKCCD